MENKKTDIKTQNEDRIGIIPLSQIKGSDADSAHQDDASVEEHAKQAAKSDSDIDEQTGKSNTEQTDY
jgi:hypothetical protein